MGRPRLAKHPKSESQQIEPENESQEPPEEEPPDPEPEFKLEQPANDNGTATISKADAVRQAIAAGMEKPADGVAFIKANFGIDLPKQMWSSYRAQQKARERKAEGGEPSQAPKAAEPASAPPRPAPADNLISDIAAVKHLVEKLGAEQVRQLVGLFE